MEKEFETGKKVYPEGEIFLSPKIAFFFFSPGIQDSETFLGLNSYWTIIKQIIFDSIYKKKEFPLKTKTLGEENQSSTSNHKL